MATFARRLLSRGAKTEKLIFSGIQSSGVGHLGNYLGAVRNWVRMQESHKDAQILYSVVDLHAITVFQDPSALRKNTHDILALIIACGIDTERTILFQQSRVPQHAELAWILGCSTSTGLLNRMTQWKAKSKEKVPCLGLYSYPVLMAADIMLYRGTHVPVGEDNMQHLELARDIATTFNAQYDIPYFPRPEAILGEVPRVMSLRAPDAKMSKSDPSEFSRINMTDTRDEVYAKIRKAVTDSTSSVTFEPETRPGVSNLIQLYAAMASISTGDVVAKFHGRTTAQLKDGLATVISDALDPIQTLLNQLRQDPQHVQEVNRRGVQRATEIAERNMRDIRRIVGLD